MTLPPSTRLGPYEIIGMIGKGGMGEVYRARDPRLGRAVAVKILPAAFSADPDRLARFKLEARAAGQLNHPNILVIHDIGLHDGAPYIVSELLEGETLRQRLISGPIPIQEVCEQALQVAHGLMAAHESGVVHRDLKPANLFLTRDGRLKILDFGLAKLVQAEDRSTVTSVPSAPAETEPGVVLGTAGYMAPEQVRGFPADQRSDIFAFGAVLFEMLSGRRAFQGASAADTMSAILKENPPELVALNPGVSPALERVVRRCLEKDPAKRYQSARDLASALQLHSDVAVDYPAHTARFSRLWPAGAAAAVLLVAAVLWLFHNARTPEPAPAPFSTGVSLAKQVDVASIAVLPFVNMSEDASAEYFSDGIAEELLNALARIPGLRVMGRTSSFAFKGKNEDLRVIGQKLNVTAILEGSVRKSGNRVRVMAQLVGAADGFHLWSEAYDRELVDILAVQENIARSVAGALKVTLLGAKETAAKVHSGNTDAYNAYLQAKYFYNRQSEEDLERAVAYFQQALTLDPGYASAWAGLASVFSNLADNGHMPVDEGYRQARSALVQAQALDPHLAETHSTLGWISLAHDWDWDRADEEFKQAYALEPGNADVAFRASWLAATTGRFDEAMALNRRALELDPLNVAAWYWLGLRSWYVGRMDEAKAAFDKALELNPEFPGTHWCLGLVHLSQGRAEAALEESGKENLAWASLQGRVLANHALARDGEANAILGELIEKFQGEWAYQIAQVYAFRGDADKAFDWLERAYVQRDAGLTIIKGDPLLKNLESDPRHAAFLEKMRLPL